MTEAVDFNHQVIEEFRTNGGKVGGMFEGASMLILHTTGAKSGREIVTPLVCHEDGDRLLIYASKGGADDNPAWYHNLVANPGVTVEWGNETLPMRATVITGEERDRLFAEQVVRAPGFGAYQARTSRIIPVIALQRT